MFFKSIDPEIIQQHVVFTDNDFLGHIFRDEELLKETLSLLAGKKLFIYPFTEFEFLRDVYTPKSRALMEQFLSSATFGHMGEKIHLEVFPKLLTNALLLSKIFAHHNNCKCSTNNKSISFVDLLLASLLMFLKDKSILITGNKKDFPSCVFDIVGVLNFEANDECVRVISIVKFNQYKFNECYDRLEKLEAKNEKAY